MSTADILHAIHTKDFHSANEAFSNTMQAKLADALAVIRKQTFNETLVFPVTANDVQRVYDELQDPFETELLCNVKGLQVNEHGQVVAFVSEATDRQGWTTVKTIPSHVGVTRFYDECDNGGAFIGWVVRQPHIPSPYSSGPDHAVMRWKGKNVVMAETSHKRYEVIEVPSSEHIYATDQEATDAYIAKIKSTRT